MCGFLLTDKFFRIYVPKVVPLYLPSKCNVLGHKPCLHQQLHNNDTEILAERFFRSMPEQLWFTTVL